MTAGSTGGSSSVEQVKNLEHAVVSDAEIAVDALIDVVEQGSTFIPKEAANVATDLLTMLRAAKQRIESAGGGTTTKG